MSVCLSPSNPPPPALPPLSCPNCSSNASSAAHSLPLFPLDVPLPLRPHTQSHPPSHAHTPAPIGHPSAPSSSCPPPLPPAGVGTRARVRREHCQPRLGVGTFRKAGRGQGRSRGWGAAEGGGEKKRGAPPAWTLSTEHVATYYFNKLGTSCPHASCHTHSLILWISFIPH